MAFAAQRTAAACSRVRFAAPVLFLSSPLLSSPIRRVNATRRALPLTVVPYCNVMHCWLLVAGAATPAHCVLHCTALHSLASQSQRLSFALELRVGVRVGVGVSGGYELRGERGGGLLRRAAPPPVFSLQLVLCCSDETCRHMTDVQHTCYSHRHKREQRTVQYACSCSSTAQHNVRVHAVLAVRAAAAPIRSD